MISNNRTNVLLDSVIGELQPMVTAGDVKHVIVADDDFSDALEMRGKYDLPLFAVAYGGAANAGPLGTNREAHQAAQGFIVFAVTRKRAGADSTLVELYDLKDAVIDLLGGKTPVEKTRAGVATTGDNGDELPLAAKLLYAGDRMMKLPNDVEKKGVRCWVVRFSTEIQFMPNRAELTDPDELEGVDGTMDPRPGDDPATPDGDLPEFEFNTD